MDTTKEEIKIREINNDNEFEQTIKDLKDNPAFQMSLSGKELFHSNMIAMFLTQEEDDVKSKKTPKGNCPKIPSSLAKQIISFFPPIINGKENSDLVVFDVLREYKNLDLVICYCTQENKNSLNDNNFFCVADFTEDSSEKDDESNSCEENVQDNFEKALSEDVNKALENMHYVIVENKFKSFPYKEQLDKYSDKEFPIFKKHKINNKTCYLLAPNNSLRAFFNSNNPDEYFGKFGNKKEIWRGKSYENYWERLEKYYLENKITATSTNKLELQEDEIRKNFILNFIKEYSDFLNIMLALYDYCVQKRIETEEKCFLKEHHNNLLLQRRIQDFYEKIIYNRTLTKLRNDKSISLNKIIEISKDGEFAKSEDKNGPFFYSEAGYSRQTGMLDFRYLWPNSYINTGIQIQGNQFRIVFSHEIDAFKKVFCISRWAGNYSKFQSKLKTKKDLLDLQDFNDEENLTLKCIMKLDTQIQEEMKKHNIKIPKIKFKDENKTVYSYAVSNKYNFRYGFYDLNEVHNAIVTKKSGPQSYRELDYDTLKTFIKVCCEVISNPENSYEVLRNTK